MAKWCNSNETLSHLYVYDTTGEQHRTHNNSFSFEGNNLFSYSTQIATIDRKKKRVIMLSRYSTFTTNRHLWFLRKALPSDYTIIYSNCFVWKDLYKTFLKQVQTYYKQTQYKRKNNICSKVEDRISLAYLKRNLYAINKYDYLEKHHKDLYDFITNNLQYEDNRIKTLEENRKKAAEERQARINAAVQCLENYLKSKDCEKLIQNVIEHENISDKTLINLVKIRQSLRTVILNYLKTDKHLLEIDSFCDVSYILNSFILKRLFNIPKKGPYQIYDLVYFDHNNLKLMTTRSVTIQTDKNSLKAVIKLIKFYLLGKLEYLVGKHIGPYAILKADAYEIQVGCHTFHYKNIELLYKELKQYE